MPRLGILFTLEQGAAQDVRLAAYQTLLAVLSPAQMAGCVLSEAALQAASAGHSELFCLVLTAAEAERLTALRSSLNVAEARGLAPLAQRFLEESQLNPETLVQIAQLDEAGALLADAPDWLRQIWPSNPAPPAARAETAISDANEAPLHSAEAAPSVGPSAATVAAAPFALRTNPAWPVEIPFILAVRDTRLRLLTGLLGVGLGVLTSVLLFLLAKRGSMLEQMFNLRHFSTLVPIAISSMFFWGLLLCGWRWWRLRTLERMSAQSLLLDATCYLATTDLAALAHELEDPVGAASPLLRRLQAVVKQWRVRPGLAEADLILQQHIAHDEEGVHAGYNLLRTFIWALPVLGLIGTVIGISLSVGGFAQFLGGNIDDVAIVKQNLVSVTGGLSFAFLITLQGLLTSLLLMLATSGLQTREEKLYATLQQGITDHFLPQLQTGAPAPQAVAQVATLESWREPMQELARGVIETLRAEGLQMFAALDDRQLAQREQALEWAQTLRQETEAGAARLGEAASRVGSELAHASGVFLERLAQVQAVFDQQAATWRENLATQARAVAAQQAELKLALAAQAQTLQTTAEVLRALDATTQSALAQQTALQAALRQLNEAQLGRAFDNFATGLVGQTAQLQTATEALLGVTRLSGEMLQAQAALQASVNQLREAGLAQTLADFRDSLANLGPVLASFRQPFVWQAMPLPSNTHSVG